MRGFAVLALASILAGWVPSHGIAQAPAGASAARDRIGLDIMVGHREHAGWVLHDDDTGMFFRATVHGGTVNEEQPFTAAAGTFRDVRRRLAGYRAMAQDGEGCPVTERDFLAFRINWIEAGRRHTATFADSCGGVPTDFMDTIRPINQQFDRLVSPSPQETAGPEHAGEDGR